MRDVRVCFAGDSFVLGVGDPKALGWVGRVAARTTGVALTAYNLGVRGESIGEVGARLRHELPPRFALGDEHRLVVAAGVKDAFESVAVDESATALAAILSDSEVPCLVVGPPPVGPPPVCQRLGELDPELRTVCESAGVPYIATYEALAHNPDWARDQERSADGVHPGQTGYGLLAWLVLHGGWYSWLGLPEPAVPVVRRGSGRLQRPPRER